MGYCSKMGKFNPSSRKCKIKNSAFGICALGKKEQVCGVNSKISYKMHCTKNEVFR